MASGGDTCSLKPSGIPGCCSGPRSGSAHWFVFIAFGALFFTLITAYGQLFDPRFALPIIGHWPPYEWASEIIAWAGLISISFLIIVRLLLTGRGRESRFFGSRSWQGFYVELTVLGIVLCVLALHAMEYRLLGAETSRLHFPLTWFLLPAGYQPRGARNRHRDHRSDQDHHLDGVVHRHRPQHDDGRCLASIHQLAEHLVQARVLGQAGARCAAADHDRQQAARFRQHRGSGRGHLAGCWQGGGLYLEGIARLHLLHRVRSLPVPVPGLEYRQAALPKLLIMDLREHAYAKAPYLQAAEAAREALPEATRQEAARPLVGPIEVTDGVPGVIDPDVLWSCTTCGACVQQCPVDIEHVDHILDMRRFEVMMSAEFPSELNGLFKGLESKGNPWNMSPRGRHGLGQGSALFRAGRR